MKAKDMKNTSQQINNSECSNLTEESGDEAVSILY